MKYIIMIIISLALFSCNSNKKEQVIKGYPVYNFLNLGEVSEEALSVWKQVSKMPDTDDGFIREGFEAMADFQEKLIKEGLGSYNEITIITDSGERTSVYIPINDYENLWKKSPHDLVKDGTSHFLDIDYEVLTVDGEKYLKAIKVNSRLVKHKPYLTK